MEVSENYYKRLIRCRSMYENLQIIRATLVSQSPAEVLKRIYMELDETKKEIEDELSQKD